MIKKEITTIAEVWRFYALWTFFDFVACLYTSHFFFLIAPVTGLAFMGLVTLCIKKRVANELVGVKILDGFSGLIHAVVCSALFALFTQNGIRSFFVHFVPATALVIVLVMTVNKFYVKLRDSEKSFETQKSVPVFLLLLLPVVFFIKIYARNNIVFAMQFYSASMSLFHCTYTTSFSRAKELMYNENNDKE